jgi:hypothetical protein
MTQQVLGGLDGSNPLGFLAAVGLLRWLVDECGHTEARLSFRPGEWRAVLHDGPPLDALVADIAGDARGWVARAPLAFTYTVTKEKKGVQVTETCHDLKPPPDQLRDWLHGLRAAGDATAVAFAAAFGPELGRDGGGMVKPTALHFTAGQQEFLGAACEIANLLVEDDVREALLGPWRYARAAKTLRWDGAGSRGYAYRADDPSDGKNKSGQNPGADWLALQGLPLLPTASRGSATLTAGCGGGWKAGGYFRWPLWDRPAGLGTVRSLLVSADVERWTPAQRRVTGISAVFACGITRTDQGGYGSFEPAHVASPEERPGAR